MPSLSRFLAGTAEGQNIGGNRGTPNKLSIPVCVLFSFLGKIGGRGRCNQSPPPLNISDGPLAQSVFPYELMQIRGPFSRSQNEI